MCWISSQPRTKDTQLLADTPSFSYVHRTFVQPSPPTTAEGSSEVQGISTEENTLMYPVVLNVIHMIRGEASPENTGCWGTGLLSASRNTSMTRGHWDSYVHVWFSAVCAPDPRPDGLQHLRVRHRSVNSSPTSTLSNIDCVLTY